VPGERTRRGCCHILSHTAETPALLAVNIQGTHVLRKRSSAALPVEMSKPTPEARTRKVGRPSIKLGKELITPFFNMPQHAAARHLGISLSGLKNVCHKHGILHWPYKRSGGSNDSKASAHTLGGMLASKHWPYKGSGDSHDMKASARTIDGTLASTLGCGADWNLPEYGAPDSDLPVCDDYSPGQFSGSLPPTATTWQSVSHDMLPGLSSGSMNMLASSVWVEDGASDVDRSIKMARRCSNVVELSGSDRCMLSRHNVRTYSKAAAREFHHVGASHEIRTSSTRAGSSGPRPASPIGTWSQRFSLLLAAPATTDLTLDRDFIDIVEAQAVHGYLEMRAAEATSYLGNLFPTP